MIVKRIDINLAHFKRELAETLQEEHDLIKNAENYDMYAFKKTFNFKQQQSNPLQIQSNSNINASEKIQKPPQQDSYQSIEHIVHLNEYNQIDDQLEIQVCKLDHILLANDTIFSNDSKKKIKYQLYSKKPCQWFSVDDDSFESAEGNTTYIISQHRLNQKLFENKTSIKNDSKIFYDNIAHCLNWGELADYKLKYEEHAAKTMRKENNGKNNNKMTNIIQQMQNQQCVQQCKTELQRKIHNDISDRYYCKNGIKCLNTNVDSCNKCHQFGHRVDTCEQNWIQLCDFCRGPHEIQQCPQQICNKCNFIGIGHESFNCLQDQITFKNCKQFAHSKNHYRTIQFDNFNELSQEMIHQAICLICQRIGHINCSDNLIGPDRIDSSLIQDDGIYFKQKNYSGDKNSSMIAEI